MSGYKFVDIFYIYAKSFFDTYADLRHARRARTRARLERSSQARRASVLMTTTRRNAPIVQYVLWGSTLRERRVSETPPPTPTLELALSVTR